MRNSSLFILCACLVVGGCFNVRTPKPIAGEVEESFRNRWVAKRMTELQTSGTTPDAREARGIAMEEFKKQYPFTAVAQKPDPMATSGAAH